MEQNVIDELVKELRNYKHGDPINNLVNDAADKLESIAPLVNALESCEEQLTLLAKSPETNPWVKEARQALSAFKAKMGEKI